MHQVEVVQSIFTSCFVIHVFFLCETQALHWNISTFIFFFKHGSVSEMSTQWNKQIFFTEGRQIHSELRNTVYLLPVYGLKTSGLQWVHWSLRQLTGLTCLLVSSPQNALLPAGLRQKDQTTKNATGPFDRDSLLKYLEKEAMEYKDREDIVPFTGEKKGVCVCVLLKLTRHYLKKVISMSLFTGLKTSIDLKSWMVWSAWCRN